MSLRYIKVYRHSLYSPVFFLLVLGHSLWNISPWFFWVITEPTYLGIILHNLTLSNSRGRNESSWMWSVLGLWEEGQAVPQVITVDFFFSSESLLPALIFILLYCLKTPYLVVPHALNHLFLIPFLYHQNCHVLRAFQFA